VANDHQTLTERGIAIPAQGVERGLRFQCRSGTGGYEMGKFRTMHEASDLDEKENRSTSKQRTKK
jgi:hypothetical protein